MIYDHTQYAVSQGHQVDILSPMSEGDELYPAPAGSRVIACRRNEWISRFFREVSLDLYHYLRKHAGEYDIIHCHGLWHFASVTPFLLDHRVPKVLTIHGVLDAWARKQSAWKKNLVDALIQKKLVMRADLIHILNEDERQDVERYLGRPHPRIVLIPNGIRVQDFSGLPPGGKFREQLGLPDDKKLVLFMSRINSKKGLDLLLPAFRDYCARHDDAVLVLAGSDDGYLAQTQAFIRENGLDRQILLAGMVTGETKLNAFADADAFVLPSYSEGLSMAVLEAMAAGVPTVVSDRVGLGREVGRTQAACLTDLKPDAVREGIEQVLHDPAYAETLSRNARRLVETRYDISIVSERLLQEYGKLVERSAQRIEPLRA